MKTSFRVSVDRVETRYFTEEEIIAALLPAVPKDTTIEIEYDQDDHDTKGKWVHYPVVIRLITKSVEES